MSTATVLDLDGTPALWPDQITANLWDRLPDTLSEDARADATHLALARLAGQAAAVPGVRWWLPQERRLALHPGHQPDTVVAALAGWVGDPPPGVLADAAAAAAAG